jgi:hypothetical protein
MFKNIVIFCIAVSLISFNYTTFAQETHTTKSKTEDIYPIPHQLLQCVVIDRIA